jgi:hypothetical protein
MLFAIVYDIAYLFVEFGELGGYFVYMNTDRGLGRRLSGIEIIFIGI